MESVLRFFGKYERIRGSWTGLPGWARNIVLLFALPGIVLCLLSILALLVSILALLLLTVPVYRLMQVVTGSGNSTPISEGESSTTGSVFDAPPMTGPRKRVESTVIDPAPGVDET